MIPDESLSKTGCKEISMIDSDETKAPLYECVAIEHTTQKAFFKSTEMIYNS